MNPYRQVAEALSYLPGVRGAVVAAPDGVIVDALVHHDVRADQVAAFGTAVFRAASAVAVGAAVQEPRYVAIEAERGKLCLTGNDEVTLVVLVDAHTASGRIRMAMRQALEALA